MNKTGATCLALLLLGVALATRAEDITFKSGECFPIYDSASDIEVADLNEDGHADVAMSATVDVSVFLGDGSGHLIHHGEFPTGSSSNGIVSGDFDEDGHLDLAATNFYIDNIAILIGDGTGNFLAPVPFSVGDGPKAIIAADFDHDAHLDLAVNNVRDHTISILRGDGQGGFLVENTLPLEAEGFRMIADDLDNDGNPDIVITTAGGIVMFFGDGTLGFGPPATLASVLSQHVRSGDFNGDGNKDLVASEAGLIQVLLGNGSGDFSPTDPVDGGSHGYLATGDFNEDGFLDVLVSRGSILLGDGTGHLLPHRTIAGAWALLALADFDEDGHLDVFSPGYPFAVVIRGYGTGDFHAPDIHKVGPGLRYAACGDVNEDGYLDVVFVNRYVHSISVLQGDGLGRLRFRCDFPAGEGPLWGILKDLNGDGHLDAALANETEDVSVLLGDGAGGFSAPQAFAVGNGPRSLVAGDFNEDGKTDLAVAIGPGRCVSILLGDGSGGFGTGQQVPVPYNIACIQSADFNEDGHLDLVVGRNARPMEDPGDVLWVLFGDGAGGFGQPQAHSHQALEAECIVPFDANEDGHTDLAVSMDSHYIVLILGTGDGELGDATIVSPYGYSRSCTAADLDGDGHVDLAVQANIISLLRGDGAGGFSPVGQVANAGGWLIFSGEFSEDGQVDVLSVHTQYNESAVFLNYTHGSSDIALCMRGNVNADGGPVADVLRVNDSIGDEQRVVEVLEGDPIRVEMLLPPAGGDGRFVVHANLGAPLDETATMLPQSVGLFCFPFLLTVGGHPAAIWNSLGKTKVAGESEYFDGSSIPDPDPAPVLFLHLPEGDPSNLPTGTTVTFQGIIVDPNAISHRGGSVTNAVILKVL